MHASFVIAEAFVGPDGTAPERYSPCATIPKLAAAFEDPATFWTPRYLVAEVNGQVVAIGGYARSRAAGSTWELLLGATLPAYQGRGIGHALVLARWDAIRAEATDGGIVMVSTRRPARFLRYGFSAGPVNPDTGATLMWLPVAAEGRAAA
ncbi:GNAT family N-acetyltransferase [Magnetospirillum aberrantis]|uniref:GNAT family N-acetyltransferase n=1 Tax=Magnetospirillum aberrantis SpK TaxID=908842 RepID=A0A7C9QTE7_9PROT|nr:GNAT family N-acetyltransferase [Magnetospirillum aberrantis SpK]